MLVTDGGFLPDGAFRPLAWLDSRHVERLFRAEVLRMLLEKELITEAIVNNLLSWRHSGFSAHGAVRVEDRAGAGRLGRYMIRCPVVLKRLTWEEDTGEVVYRGRPSRRAGLDGGHARWDVLEFLARVVDHIPEPSQQMVRYWGFYANAARGKRRKAAPAADGTPMPRQQGDADESTRRARLSWAKLIHRVYEVDPILTIEPKTLRLAMAPPELPVSRCLLVGAAIARSGTVGGTDKREVPRAVETFGALQTRDLPTPGP